MTNNVWGKWMLWVSSWGCGFCRSFQGYSWAPSQYKTVFLVMGILIIKMRRSSDRLIFIMGIPILVRRLFYIETVPLIPIQNALYFVLPYLYSLYCNRDWVCLVIYVSQFQWKIIIIKKKKWLAWFVITSAGRSLQHTPTLMVECRIRLSRNNFCTSGFHNRWVSQMRALLWGLPWTSDVLWHITRGAICFWT